MKKIGYHVVGQFAKGSPKMAVCLQIQQGGVVLAESDCITMHFEDITEEFANWLETQFVALLNKASIPMDCWEYLLGKIRDLYRRLHQ
jgi:hypothetical protein